MKIQLTGIAVMLGVLLCASTASAFDDGGYSRTSKSWGASARAVKNAQIANPDAGKVTGPIEGFDGKAAENTMDAYHDSFTVEKGREGYSLDSISVVSPGGQY